MFRFFLLIAAFSLVGCKEDRAESGSVCPKIDAYSAVKSAVAQRLVSPGSAVFPGDPGPPLFSNAEVIIATKGDCVFGVSAYVDSQNRLGGLIRSNFSATVAYNRASEKWRVSELVVVDR